MAGPTPAFMRARVFAAHSAEEAAQCPTAVAADAGLRLEVTVPSAGAKEQPAVPVTTAT